MPGYAYGDPNTSLVGLSTTGGNLQSLSQRSSDGKWVYHWNSGDILDENLFQKYYRTWSIGNSWNSGPTTETGNNERTNC